MIKYIHQLFVKLFTNFNKKPKIVIVDQSEDFNTSHENGSISFILDKHNNVDIYCILPEISKPSDDELLDVSEKYAKLLLSLNKGIFKSEINKILKQRKNKSNNATEQLLIDNIFIFYKLLEQELFKMKSSNEPIIRPTQVFKIN